MKKSHVLFDFVLGIPPVKIVFGRNVITLMTGNANFPTPDILLTVIKDKTDLLEQKLIASLNEGKAEKAELHQVEKEWDNLMRYEALYVDRIADGDEAIIKSAGFSVSKQPVANAKPELLAEAGDRPGTVKLHRQAVQGAKSYVWQSCMNTFPESESQWAFADATSKATVILENLVSVTRYWFRVAAVTTEGTSAYCDPIMHVVA
ncbi:MAG TPA: hypothetical protein VIK55_02395 [Paludibacter sp.]